MTDVDGRQWAVVVFGPVVVLIALVAVGYAGLFVVPGAPCAGAGGLSPPPSAFAVTSNGSSVTVVHVGNRSVGGPSTDRIAVSIRNAETPKAVGKTWIGSGETLSRGDSITIAAREIPFSLTDRDRVSVQWYGVDPDKPGFCPNGRAFHEVTVVTLENASLAIRTGT